MDKNAIKKYAIWARRELIEKVSQKALQYGIEDGAILDSNVDSVNGKLLSSVEKKQREALINKIKVEGYLPVIEEVAFTWFNRFVALRFMEVNGYIPSHIRVFSDENNSFRPQLLSEALHVEFGSLDKDIIIEMKQDNKDEELFKYLLVGQCNELSTCLPRLFQKIADYSELLLPDYLLREGSVIEQLVNTIPEEDWTNQVQIIGWLYQYYNTEPKAKVFSKTGTAKVEKEEIPAATQLFTPDWIVRYLVENSLGRYWILGHEESNLSSKLKYLVEDNKQNDSVEASFLKIKDELKNKKPDEIRIIDPCMGSGHMLVYCFDILISIYEECGYTTREAVQSIVKNNIWGLDIDERAAQLSYFAIMMKARQYDRRFFTHVIEPNVCVVEESNKISKELIEYFVGGDEIVRDNFEKLLALTKDAKEYGSILSISDIDFERLYDRLEKIKGDISLYSAALELQIVPLIKSAKILADKYSIVITNPPYMGNGSMDAKLSAFVKKNYNAGRNDLFGVFIMRCMEFTEKYGIQAMITQHQWMFLSSYEKIRNAIYKKTLLNMLHLGARAFDEISGEVVQTAAFTIMNTSNKSYLGQYFRLINEKGEEEKEKAFFGNPEKYMTPIDTFLELPGIPMVYWIDESIKRLFENTPADNAISLREGIHTGKNELFLRNWQEISYEKLVLNAKSEQDVDALGTWVPYNKGGTYRKWYGNNELVIGFDKVHRDAMARLSGHVRPSQSLYFKEGGTWSALASGNFGLRYYPEGFLFDSKGQVAVGEKAKEIIGLFNLKVYQEMADMLMPTLDYKCGDVKKLPYCHVHNAEFLNICNDCINLAKEEYDSYETSWNFKKHPLVKNVSTIREAFALWEKETEQRFEKLKENERKLNLIFCDEYEIADSYADIKEEDITLRKANLVGDIKGLISYAVGCMFGRYSLDKDGIVFAGGDFKSNDNSTYPVDKDNIIPICDDEYFEDDIVGLFIKFIEKVYGEKNLQENLQFIVDALNLKGSPREALRKYFLNDFYKDHCALYSSSQGKTPIYWLFDSGKNNGFKCLIYMHRYQPDTVARIRTDYVHEQQARYRTAIEEITNRMESASGSDKVKLTKKLNTLKMQNDEIHAYEEKIHHLADQMISIDLDDGVKKNYEIFKDVLAKIK